jgi:hypothetical protein
MELGNRPKNPSKNVAKSNLKRGRKKLFKQLQQVMVYVDVDMNEDWDMFSHSYGVSKSQIAREALEMRLHGGGAPFQNGFNNGIDAVLKEAESIEAFKMTFPSGKTFANLLRDEADKLRRDDGAGKS